MIRKAWKGGSFNTYISRLRQKGFVEGSGAIKITQEGLDYAASNGLANERDNKVSLENWLTKLGGGTKKIYEVLLSDPSRGFTKEEIGEQAQMVCTGGSFNTYVSRLWTLCWLKRKMDSSNLTRTFKAYELLRSEEIRGRNKSRLGLHRPGPRSLHLATGRK